MANKKAHRWGVKVWVLSESQTGYTHQVEMYKGKSNTARYPNGLAYVFFTITTFHKYESDNLQTIYSVTANDFK